MASSALTPTEYYATGRRKTSTARVFLRPGTGTITVNHREFANYFPTEMLRMNVRRPLVLTEVVDKFDIVATVDGGGVNSQSGAVRPQALPVQQALIERSVRRQADRERRSICPGLR